ncbi:helix-turn-helix domain-containing protein [Clostridium estertheticum]|uniref:helix-turn-helix domain-containing protein n=1 Tax=Clostridium estertheticum TaxID=238834 RepID=UPI001C0BD323|nr:helix-turn-helix transcriptional regulator [Clostridium estertheticum]MBU3174422.1 helix-turn-helix transcriptional regulator [Clostridium estertheticum]
MFIGERLKFLRTQNHMTQKELALLLNLERTSITSIESNRTQPTLKYLENFCDIFDVSIYYFLNREVPHNKLQFNVVRKIFNDKDDCIKYLAKHEAINDLNLEKLNDEELIEFANEIQKYIEILSYKYRRF